VSEDPTLLPGEAPIKNAPAIKLENGFACIPQHYLKFRHTQESLEQIVVEINYCDRYPVFVCNDSSGLYIQVGIIGYDNYASHEKQSASTKIVYGRKWRVEPELPSSEVIQTVFLAIKKAREHEIRELFRLTNKGQYSTPFNNHHDFPLMAQNEELLDVHNQEQNAPCDLTVLAQALEKIRYDRARFTLEAFQSISSDRWLVDLSIQPETETSLPELNSSNVTLVLENLNINEFYYELMEVLLKLSDRHVEEHFSYRGFCRFSRKNCIEALGELSKHVRRRDNKQFNAEFEAHFTQSNYQTDLTRVPNLGNGLNARKIRSQLAYFDKLDGILPTLTKENPAQ